MSFVSPLDMLTVTSAEQDVIRCLVRRPHLTASEISAYTKIPLKELDELLPRMVSDSRLVENLRENVSRFNVPFGKEKQADKSGQKGESLLDRLFS